MPAFQPYFIWKQIRVYRLISVQRCNYMCFVLSRKQNRCWISPVIVPVHAYWVLIKLLLRFVVKFVAIVAMHILHNRGLSAHCESYVFCVRNLSQRYLYIVTLGGLLFI